MKAIRILFVGAVVITTACSDVTLTSDVAGADELESIVTQPKFVEATYYRDLRPVDGGLTEITVRKTGKGVFELVRSETYFSRMTGEEIKTEEVLAENLSCERDERNVTCERDLRPVDGALIEVTITERSDYKFNGYISQTWFDRQQGKEVTTSEELGTSMMVRPFVTDIFVSTVPGSFTEVRLIEAVQNTMTVTMSRGHFDTAAQEFVREPAEIVVEEATCLRARSAIVCTKDLTAVDGSTVEVRIERNRKWKNDLVRTVTNMWGDVTTETLAFDMVAR